MHNELKQVRKNIVATTGLPDTGNHDPSNIIRYKDRYYCWYTQHWGEWEAFLKTKVMVVTSADGYRWEHKQDALVPSTDKKAWDCEGVLTAYVVPWESRYYMFYSGVGSDYVNANVSPRGIGIAIADTPDGPWERLGKAPVLFPEPGKWDEVCCDDANLIFHDERWLFYYKGRKIGSQPHSSQIGLATSTDITGPFTKHEANPLIAGHALSLWPYKEGFLFIGGGNNQKLYWSEDGLRFEECCDFPNAATGLYTKVVQDGSQQDVSAFWGIDSAQTSGESGNRNVVLERFDIVLE